VRPRLRLKTKKLLSLISSLFSALSHSKSHQKRQASGFTEMASSSAAASTDDRNDRGLDLSLTSDTDCSVCSNLTKDNMIIGMGDLFRSATTQGCEGCKFLFELSQQAHFSLRGHHLEPGQIIFINYGMMYPPKEFLILPRKNVIDQSGKIEVFKTFPLGRSSGINLKPPRIHSQKANT
jgi:hypothetical protein